jgi:hypothetical protein
MSQKSSVPQAVSFVSQVLKRDTSGKILVQATFGAELLKRRSVANETETASAYFTTRFRLGTLRLFACHQHFS